MTTSTVSPALASTAHDLDALEDALDVHHAPPSYDEEARAAFQLNDDSMAHWAMRKLHRNRSRVDEIQALADAEIRRIQEWAVDAIHRPADDAAFFEALLKDYALRVRQDDPARKTITTPHGTVTTRTGQPTWKTDATLLLPWAQEHCPAAVKVETSLLVGPLKTALEAQDDGTAVDPATGEVVPGITVQPGATTAAVKVGP